MLRGYVWVVFVQGWQISCGSKFVVFFFEGSCLEAFRRVLIDRKGFNSERQGWRGWNQKRWSTAMKDLGETKEILNLGNGWHVINSLTCVDICNLFSTSVDGLWLLGSGFNKECLHLKQLEVMEWFHSASIYGVVQVVLCSSVFSAAHTLNSTQFFVYEHCLVLFVWEAFWHPSCVNHDLSMIIWSRVWYFVSDPHKGYMTGLIIMLTFTMLLWSCLCNFVDRLVGMYHP
jgi:hypothetical protein